jgi:hypothetical protein
MRYAIKASYGNDSIALIQWMADQGHTDSYVVHNDTGWARSSWRSRVQQGEAFARSLGMEPITIHGVLDAGGHCIDFGMGPIAEPASDDRRGFVALVRLRRAFPRHGMQFCTSELKIRPTVLWASKVDPGRDLIGVVGVRREESERRSQWPEWVEDSEMDDGRSLWSPLVRMTKVERNAMIERAGFEVLPHRSEECFACVNSNRLDVRRLGEDEPRVAEIEDLELDLGNTGAGKPRVMFRSAKKGGASGIREIIRWANSAPGTYRPEVDGQMSFDCDAGFCGG